MSIKWANRKIANAHIIDCIEAADRNLVSSFVRARFFREGAVKMDGLCAVNFHGRCLVFYHRSLVAVIE